MICKDCLNDSHFITNNTVHEQVVVDGQGEFVKALDADTVDNGTPYCRNCGGDDIDFELGKDYRDKTSGAWARITHTHLTVIPNHRCKAVTRYALADILYASHNRLPGGQTAVFVCLRGAVEGQGFTFHDTELADRFAGDLQDALQPHRASCPCGRHASTDCAGECS